MPRNRDLQDYNIMLIRSRVAARGATPVECEIDVLRFEAIADAKADGYTHVRTAAGWVPLTHWPAINQSGRALEYDPERGCLYGPWRDLSSLEEIACEDLGWDMHKSRDRWDLSAGDEITGCPYCGGEFHDIDAHMAECPGDDWPNEYIPGGFERDTPPFDMGR